MIVGWALPTGYRMFLKGALAPPSISMFLSCCFYFVGSLDRWRLLARGGLAGPRRAQGSDPFAAFAADAFFRPVGRHAATGPGRLIARGADQQDVGYLYRHLFGEPAPLRVSLAAPHVLVDAVDPLYDELAGFPVDGEDLAGHSLVVSGDDFDRVPRSYVHHTTSAAKLTIFMKLFSRSSRATAPKMRVPRGLPSLSISTSALLSNRT